MAAPVVTGVLLWQHELTWSLVDLHLDGMSDEDLHWRPAPISWSLHPTPDGGWVPDWADEEPAARGSGSARSTTVGSLR